MVHYGMRESELNEIERQWSPDASDIHNLIAALRRPACERAINAVMNCDQNERDLIRRLCNALDEVSSPL